jgi:hypothetical protein
MSRDRTPHCGVVGAAQGWMVEGGLSLVGHCGNGGNEMLQCGNRNQNKYSGSESSSVTRVATNHPTTAASSPAACFVWLVAQPARFTQLPTRTCSLISSVRPVECESRTGAVSVRHVDGRVWQRSFKTRSAVHGHELVLPQLVRAQTSSPLRSLRVPAARQRALTGRAGVCCVGRARMR